MQVPTLEDIRTARTRIAPYVVETPLRRWEYLRRKLGFEAPTFLKLETFQNTGSFKVRGAANKILALVQEGKTARHFVAASAGNHAQAVAFVAGRLGLKSTIVMPEGTPLVKAAATADYGADVVLHGAVYDDAYARACEIQAASPGAAYIHAYADPLVMAGQGTAGLEIHEQLLAQGIAIDSPLQVVVPIGGGGLIGGVGSALRALRPAAKIFGVVSHAADAMALSLKAGKIVAPAKGRTRTLAEGLAVKSVSELTFPVLQQIVQDVAVVDDDEVATAIATLMERGKLVAEGAGAAGVAALLAGKLPLDPKVPTVILLCGGNIDMNMVSIILERALSKSRRWLNIQFTVEDKPGELARIATRIGELRANVLEVVHDRLSQGCAVGFTRIRFRLETRGAEHALEIARALEAGGHKTEILP
jgi:threonine dehydratase